MEIKEDIVIVGAGLAGLTTSLALHRLGLKSLVLESSESLRITGFALTLWTNAWRALDAVGIGDSLRQNSTQMTGIRVGSRDSVYSLDAYGKYGSYEGRCIRRKDLLEALVDSLPSGTIRYSSKVVSIEKSGIFKVVHLADGFILKTKVLIGCDGVNSLVANWLGLQKPVSSGRSAIRGLVEYPNDMNFGSNFYVNFSGGVRFGYLPCDDKTLYWFCTFTRSAFPSYDSDTEKNPIKMKQFVLSKLGNVPQQVLEVVERTGLSHVSCAELQLRLPWNLLFGDVAKCNVTVAGDALHPMTSDISQGGCSALEDSIILARCLGEAFMEKAKGGSNMGREDELEENERIKKGLEKYAKERKWRSFSLISNSYIVGLMQESEYESWVMKFVKRWLSKYTGSAFLRVADFDCGKLVLSS